MKFEEKIILGRIIFGQTGCFEIIGVSSPIDMPIVWLDSVKVGACAQPVASSCFDRRCTNSSQTYNDSG